jgi:hypothetical protein
MNLEEMAADLKKLTPEQARLIEAWLTEQTQHYQKVKSITERYMEMGAGAFQNLVKLEEERSGASFTEAVERVAKKYPEAYQRYRKNLR